VRALGPFSDTTGHQALRGAGTANAVAVAAPEPSNPAAAIDLAVNPLAQVLPGPHGDPVLRTSFSGSTHPGVLAHCSP